MDRDHVRGGEENVDKWRDVEEQWQYTETPLFYFIFSFFIFWWGHKFQPQPPTIGEDLETKKWFILAITHFKLIKTHLHLL